MRHAGLVAVGAGTVAAAVIAVVLLVVPFADWAVVQGVTLPLLVAGLVPLGLLVSHLMPRPVRASPWRVRAVPTGRLRGVVRRRVRPLLAFAGRSADAPTIATPSTSSVSTRGVSVSGGSLPRTGGGALVLAVPGAGVAYSLPLPVALAIGAATLIVVGAVLIKLTFRRRRPVGAP